VMEERSEQGCDATRSRIIGLGVATRDPHG
jgi:hypothetical protein